MTTFLRRARGFWARSRPTLLLAVPIIAGQTSQMLMGIVDSAMVGRVSVTSLAAAAFANNLIAIPFVFGIGVLTAVSVRAAQAHGANDRGECAQVLRHGVGAAIFCGLLVWALVVALTGFLDRFGQEPEVAAAAGPFTLWIAASIFPALVAFGFKNFCESLDQPWPPTWILLGAVPINVLFNWVLIYGNLGLPAYGLEGAGMATLLSRWLALIALAWWVLRAARFRAILPARWIEPLSLGRLVSMGRIGLPAGTQITLEVGAFSLGAIMVGWLGAIPLAAHQIALSVAGTTFMIPLGLAMATTIRTGQMLGAGQLRRVRLLGSDSMLLSMVVALAFAALYLALGEAVAGAFVAEREVVTLAAHLFVVVAVFQLVDGLQVVAAGALRGLNDAAVPMLIGLLAYWVVGLPAGYALGFSASLGALGVWVGLALGLALAAFLLVLRFWRATRTRAIESPLPTPAPNEPNSH